MRARGSSGAAGRDRPSPPGQGGQQPVGPGVGDQAVRVVGLAGLKREGLRDGVEVRGDQANRLDRGQAVVVGGKLSNGQLVPRGPREEVAFDDGVGIDQDAVEVE
jgi:hypothetical protein